MAESFRPFVASGLTAAERVDAACRLAIVGKLACRDIATWLRGAAINEPEFRLLWLLSGSGNGAAECSLDQADLAERLVVSPAQVSGAVERLRNLGLLERVQHERDRRRQLWRVTNTAGELLGQIVSQVACPHERREEAA
ncbi:MarR family transcriptional regulator [Lacipirellula sp.]|uniref:MarR family transcriptional regulator n=1 Tax=Lacipirellula sp. TaxID=2691419 RepID=UPI003D131061